MRLRVFGCAVVALAAWGSVTAGTMPDPGVPFVENKRQWPSEFLYGAELKGARVYLDRDRLFFIQLSQSPDGSKGPAPLKTAFEEHSHVHRDYTAYATFEVSFVGAAAARVAPIGSQPTLFNYYLGNDPSRWAGGARAFDGVRYEGLYKGVDLVVYSQDRLLKSDWIISPCSDPSQIRLDYNGVEEIFQKDGRLHIKAELGEVIEDTPVAYQYVDGVKRTVACEYVLDGTTVSFKFPQGYDNNYELVIDPILIFSSYSGSEADNWGNTATPDGEGNLYSGGMVSGIPNSTDFPATAGAYQVAHKGGGWDIGILKYDSIGANLLYVTYLGGSAVETPQSLVVNNAGELLVLGATSSHDFPGTTPGSFKGGEFVVPLNGVTYDDGTDIFIAKLSADGTNLLAARYLGGTDNDAINFVSGNIGDVDKVESPLARNYGDQLRGDITIDSDDNVYVASSTLSDDFPIVNSDPGATFHGGTHDGVVAKMSSDLSTVIWTRMIGGSGTDVAYSVKVSKKGTIYVGGGTNSVTMAGMNGFKQTAPGGIDGWIVELTGDGSAILNGTYLGTSSYDQIYFIDISTTGDILAYGQTKGSYPIAPASVWSQLGGGQFLHKLSGDLKTSIFSTVFGKGPGPNISPTAFLVNECDNIYMAGWGGEINGPAFFSPPSSYYVGGNTKDMFFTVDAYQKVTVQGNDFYMIVLTGDVQPVYATYLGGTTSLTHVDGGTSRFDKRGIVYHAVCAGCRGNSDFPVAGSVPTIRRTNNSPNCNNAAFKFDLSSLKAKIQPNNIALTAAGDTRVCVPNAIVFENNSIGGEQYKWDLGDGTKREKLEKDTIRHYYKVPGTYIVKLTSIDVSTCIGIDSTSIVVEVFQPNMSVAAGRTICHGGSTRLEAFGAVKYEWRSSKSGFASPEQSPLVSPTETETFYVTMTNEGGCKVTAEIGVTVVPNIDLEFDAEMVYDCVERPYVRLDNKSNLLEDEEAHFSFGDGTSGPDTEEFHEFAQDGIYQIRLIGQKEHCVYEVAKEVPVVTIKVPNVITPEDSPDKNDFFKVLVGNPGALREAVTIEMVVNDRWGKEVYRSDNYRDDWNASNVAEGVYYYEIDIVGHTQCKGWVHVIK
jgi:hypothetical protein